MNQACMMRDIEVLNWEKVKQNLYVFVLYAAKFTADGDIIEKVPLARVFVASSDVEFFRKNPIEGKTVYEAFVEFVVKHTKKEAPCIFLPLYLPFGDGNWEFYVEDEVVVLLKADEEGKKRLKYLPIVKLYEVIEKIF
jgi:hypothetical protein